MPSPCGISSTPSKNIAISGGNPGDVIIIGPNGVPTTGPVPISFGGEWVDKAYGKFVMVKRHGSLYLSLVGIVPGDDAPDRYTLRSIVPRPWLEDGGYQEFDIQPQSETFFSSALNSGSGDRGLHNTNTRSRVVAFNVTTGGNVTFEWDTPIGPTGFSISQWQALVYDQSILGGIGQLANEIFGLNIFDFLGGDTNNTAGPLSVSPGVYFVMMTSRVGFFGDIKLRVTAGGGAVIGTQPVTKWVQLAYSSRGFNSYRGIAWDEAFNSPFTLTTGFVPVIANWDQAGKWTLFVDGVLASGDLLFVTPTSHFAMTPLKLTLVQAGGGSLDPALFTSITDIHGASRIPTALGPNVNDSITVWFEWTNDTASSGQFYLPVAWYSDTDNRHLAIPTTGFSITINDGAEFLLLDPAGTLATGSITMPANPQDRQTVTISSTQIVTALTLNANAGQTIKAAAVSLAAGTPAIRYVYDFSTTTWYPT